MGGQVGDAEYRTGIMSCPGRIVDVFDDGDRGYRLSVRQMGSIPYVQWIYIPQEVIHY